MGAEEIALSKRTSPVFLSLGVAVSAFLVSFVYAIITYLSSKFEYGPTAEMGEYMTEKKVPAQLYRDVLLRGYSDAIKRNRKVVQTNAKRFERCLAAFLVGLLFLFAAGVVFVLQEGLLVEVGVLVLFTAGTIRAVFYIVRENI